MSRWIDADALKVDLELMYDNQDDKDEPYNIGVRGAINMVNKQPTIDAVSVVRCEECKKSHIDGKTTHHLWCTEWGRSTDTFGYCERGEREGE